jgi:dihydroxy-acid dehydratase
VKKFGKLRPEQISKSLQVFAELKADRFFWKASGYTDAELERPVIAIANSPQDVGLGHVHLAQLGAAVREGILPAERPIYPTGGIKVLRGNLAPDGSLCRYTISGGQDQGFRGPARVFSSPREAMLAIFSGQIASGDALVIRYQGPRGGPGFSENFRVPLILGTLGLSDVAVVTDSRFSGATERALCVGYIAPEAQLGGPLAAVEEGDIIAMDCRRKRLDVELEDSVIAERLARWSPPRPPVTEGVLVDWHLTATQFPD